MWLLVGLGNPGREYETTRHNIGFLGLDYIADKMGLHINQKKFKALQTSGDLRNHKVLYLKPQTYMNLSGESVQAAATYYKIPPHKIIILHDDIDLPFQMIRVKKGGGHGGHNGIRSVTSHIGSDFIRIRMGVHRPSEKTKVHDYVLGQFSQQETEILEEIFEKSYQAIQTIMTDSVASAQQSFNNKSK